MVAQTNLSLYPELAPPIIVIVANPPRLNQGQMGQSFDDFSHSADYTLEGETYLFFEPAHEESKMASAESRERIALRTRDLSIPVKIELWAKFCERSLMIYGRCIMLGGNYLIQKCQCWSLSVTTMYVSSKRPVHTSDKGILYSNYRHSKNLPWISACAPGTSSRLYWKLC